VETGVNPNEIYLLLYENESIESLKIYSSVLSTLELFDGDRIAVISMTAEMLERSGAKYDETSLFINVPLKSHQILACIFFKENLNGVKRVSMRSKGNIDVASLALNYDGGGHKNAAGFKIPASFESFEDIKHLIIDYIKEEIRKNSL
jgi:phosphoesterase RecJ-like protein